MRFIVRVWDCTADTDIPSRELKFTSWDKAIEYIKNLPAHEGGTVEHKIEAS